MRHGLPLLLVLFIAMPSAVATQQDRPVFRSSVQRVTLSVTVRTPRGRHITDLQASDFQLFDSGRPRKITEFRTDPSPLNVAFLVDFSGSMDVASRRDAARENVRHLLSWLSPGSDRAGLYIFDKEFRELQPLAPVPGDILAQLDRVERPFGVTSLFDAIAESGRRLAEHGGSRRAVVALTDGADNASRLTPEQVSGIASSIDVPVYIVLVVSPFDRDGSGTIDDARLARAMEGPLGNLARWTGGEIFATVNPSQSSAAARQIVTDLRQQYLIAFEPGAEPGWHPIEVRTRDKDWIVRTRSGYIVRDEP